MLKCLVSPELNVEVIWASVACLLMRSLLTICLWSQLLRTSGWRFLYSWCAVISSIRYSLHSYDTAYQVMSNIPTVSNMNVLSVLDPLSCPVWNLTMGTQLVLTLIHQMSIIGVWTFPWCHGMVVPHTCILVCKCR